MTDYILTVRPDVAAEMIGFKKTKLYALLRSGEIKRIKHGRSTLIEVAELRRWMETQKQAS